MELDREKLDAYIDTVVKSQAPDLQIPPEACLGPTNRGSLCNRHLRGNRGSYQPKVGAVTLQSLSNR